MPEVSVIVPNYNHANFLDQRLNSILSQTFRDFEIILLDDNSSDNSAEILERYSLHPQVSKFVRNKTNSGSPFRQWINGISYCSGRYVWIAESDDYCETTFLQRCVSVFNKDSDVRLVYTASKSVTPDGRENDDFQKWKSQVSVTQWQQDYIHMGKEEIIAALSKRNVIGNTSSVLVDRNALKVRIGELERFRYTGDWYVWIRLLAQDGVRVGYVSQPLNYFRTAHDQSTRTRKSMDFRYAEEWFECLFEARRSFGGREYPAIAMEDMRFILSVMPISSVSVPRLIKWLTKDSLFTRMTVRSILARGTTWMRMKFTKW